jgi:hypothetical protein
VSLLDILVHRDHGISKAETPPFRAGRMSIGILAQVFAIGSGRVINDSIGAIPAFSTFLSGLVILGRRRLIEASPAQ